MAAAILSSLRKNITDFVNRLLAKLSYFDFHQLEVVWKLLIICLIWNQALTI